MATVTTNEQTAQQIVHYLMQADELEAGLSALGIVMPFVFPNIRRELRTKLRATMTAAIQETPA